MRLMTEIQQPHANIPSGAAPLSPCPRVGTMYGLPGRIAFKIDHLIKCLQIEVSGVQKICSAGIPLKPTGRKIVHCHTTQWLVVKYKGYPEPEWREASEFRHDWLQYNIEINCINQNEIDIGLKEIHSPCYSQ